MTHDMVQILYLPREPSGLAFNKKIPDYIFPSREFKIGYQELPVFMCGSSSRNTFLYVYHTFICF